jgi:hypothetical protein
MGRSKTFVCAEKVKLVLQGTVLRSMVRSHMDWITSNAAGERDPSERADVSVEKYMSYADPSFLPFAKPCTLSSQPLHAEA